MGSPTPYPCRGDGLSRERKTPRDAQCHIRMFSGSQPQPATREKNRAPDDNGQVCGIQHEFALRFPAGEGPGVRSRTSLVKHIGFFDGSKAGNSSSPLGNGTSILANIDGGIRYELDIPRPIPLEAKDVSLILRG